jgi:hypothetical protein
MGVSNDKDDESNRYIPHENLQFLYPTIGLLEHFIPQLPHLSLLLSSYSLLNACSA